MRPASPTSPPLLERGLRGEERRALCRDLRERQTPAEEFMWEMVRDRRFAGYKFRRQHSLGTYIADFYCAELHVAIELDGGVHVTQRNRDQERDDILAQYGVHVLRITNAELLTNPEQVYDRLFAMIPSSPSIYNAGNQSANNSPSPLQMERGPGGEATPVAALVAAGARLAEIHTNYEQIAPYPLKQTVTGQPFTWRVAKMKLIDNKSTLVINDTLRLESIPAHALAYKLGNRSALEWVIDQYQVTTDSRSGITSDPNRDDDEQYIVRLVGQVIAVSLETARIVEALPDLGLPTEG